jgi:predicted CopG family antitoxin
MKATIDIPDDVYRRVKAKSAIEGRPVRDVTVELFRKWIGEVSAEHEDVEATRRGAELRPAWFGSLRRYAKNAKRRHDMRSVRQSIARGRVAEWSEKETSR